MAQAHPLSQTTLQVKRTFGASRERVFRAWTDAEELRHWFFPSTDYTVVISMLDLRVGGKYQLEMHHKDSGNVHRLEGIYREIKHRKSWYSHGSGNQAPGLARRS